MTTARNKPIATEPNRAENLRLCFIVDGRIPHARNWIAYFCAAGYEVHVITTYPCEPIDPRPKSMRVVPLDFSARVRAVGQGKTQYGSGVFARLRGGALWKGLAAAKDKMAPVAVRLRHKEIRRIVDTIQPDLVHAMRIPFEGILATQALADSKIPIVVSIWGNDFTLFAEGSRLVGKLTRRAMERADALHPDCRKDLVLGYQWGFDRERPSIVVPGNGGVYTDIFYPAKPARELQEKWQIPANAPVVINPRGVKPYVRTDTFFKAIPLVLAQRPDVLFLGGMMQGNAVAEHWVEKLGLRDSIRLLPHVGQREMANYFRLAQISVSPAEHDGTPNSLLEAMACGIFPVAGDIESVREWVNHGKNGLLFDPASAQSLADALLRAIGDPELRAAAGERNPRIVAEQVEYGMGMARASDFYQEVLRCRGRSAQVSPLEHVR